MTLNYKKNYQNKKRNNINILQSMDTKIEECKQFRNKCSLMRFRFGPKSDRNPLHKVTIFIISVLSESKIISNNCESKPSKNSNHKYNKTSLHLHSTLAQCIFLKKIGNDLLRQLNHISLRIV